MRELRKYQFQISTDVQCDGLTVLYPRGGGFVEILAERQIPGHKVRPVNPHGCAADVPKVQPSFASL
jgi:hypothetical protein